MMLVAVRAATNGFPSSYSGYRGVNIHYTSGSPGETEMLSQGFKIARMDFSWSRTEETRGVYNFSAYDGLLAELEDAGVASWWILDYSNPLYCDNGESPRNTTQREAFGRWASAAVVHFEGKHTLPLVWELYNEPNGGFWKPTPNATEYGELALAVGKSVRSAAPDAVFVGPTTAGIDLQFMETVFKMGALEYFDAATCHPYRNSNPETVQYDYDSLRALIATYTPPSRPFLPIISSEWGYTTCESPCQPGGPQVTEQVQALYAVRRYGIDDLKHIPISITYDWHDDFDNKTAREANFGSVRNQYQNASLPFLPKPEYIAAKTFHNTLLSTTTSTTNRVFTKRIPSIPPWNGTYILQYQGEEGEEEEGVLGSGSGPSSSSLSSSSSSSTSSISTPTSSSPQPSSSSPSSPSSSSVALFVWSTGAQSSCAAAPTPHQDCGFDGISDEECLSRGCCPGTGPGPWCFYPNAAIPANITFAAPAPNTCYSATDVLGNPLSKVCADKDAKVTTQASQSPIYLVQQ